MSVATRQDKQGKQCLLLIVLAVSEGVSIHRLPSTLTEAEGPVACFMCLLDKPVV